jgi:hypothetical protein
MALVAAAAAALASSLLLSDVALYGYDVVEYFSLPASASGVVGSASFAHDVVGVDKSSGGASGQKMTPTNYTFHFKDAANLRAFQADPWRYLPRWGGF